jgi:hypothetical protein
VNSSSNQSCTISKHAPWARVVELLEFTVQFWPFVCFFQLFHSPTTPLLHLAACKHAKCKDRYRALLCGLSALMALLWSAVLFVK